MAPIYLDYNATTPIDPAVRAAMLPFLEEHFGNPSSAHVYGRTAHAAVETARAQVAALIHAEPEEIVFTGGGTEASNLAIKGLAFRSQESIGGHFITTTIEHPATTQPLAFLQNLGCTITALPVDRFGRADAEEARRAIVPQTKLVSVMHSNNEVGTIQPIREIAKAAHERHVLVHTEAAQSLGKVKVDVSELDVDLLSIAGHKLYAPKGVGALFIRQGIRLEPLIHGAGHEDGRRAGTENVPHIVGLGAACELARTALPAATKRLSALRDRLWDRLHAALGDRVVLNGHPKERLPNTLNVAFRDRIGSQLLAATSEIAASTGSACHDGQITLSPVLRAMGVRSEIGQGAIRLSVGRFTTEADVERAADCLIARAR
jgi:cysteine desulfurase